jgi:hypothetical protein
VIVYYSPEELEFPNAAESIRMVDEKRSPLNHQVPM